MFENRINKYEKWNELTQVKAANGWIHYVYLFLENKFILQLGQLRQIIKQNETIYAKFIMIFKSKNLQSNKISGAVRT